VASVRQPRVLLVHNRYRVAGGEERSLELQRSALEAAGIACALHERRSADAGKLDAARALVAGGSEPERVAGAVRAHGATVVHAHNMLPLIGPRGLAAARAAGARVAQKIRTL
jgi:hypothetical protein